MPYAPPPPRRALAPGLGRALAWAWGGVLLMVLAQILSDAYGGWRFDRMAYQAGAWWQLFSAQWVHFGWPHAALNMACMVLMVWAFQDLLEPGVQYAAWIGGYGGVALVIALDPACGYYAGASGALHGLWAGNALGLLVWAPSTRRWSGVTRGLGLVLLTALALKLGLSNGLALVAPVLGAVPLYGPAHGAGALGGLAAVVWWALRSRRRMA